MGMHKRFRTPAAKERARLMFIARNLTDAAEVAVAAAARAWRDLKMDDHAVNCENARRLLPGCMP